MKIKVLATAQSANYYEFSGDTVTAYLDGGSKSYDFSALQERFKRQLDEAKLARPTRQTRNAVSGCVSTSNICHRLHHYIYRGTMA